MRIYDLHGTSLCWIRSRSALCCICHYKWDIWGANFIETRKCFVSSWLKWFCFVSGHIWFNDIQTSIFMDGFLLCYIRNQYCCESCWSLLYSSHVRSHLASWVFRKFALDYPNFRCNSIKKQIYCYLDIWNNIFGQHDGTYKLCNYCDIIAAFV